MSPENSKVPAKSFLNKVTAFKKALTVFAGYLTVHVSKYTSPTFLFGAEVQTRRIFNFTRVQVLTAGLGN